MFWFGRSHYQYFIIHAEHEKLQEFFYTASFYIQIFIVFLIWMVQPLYFVIILVLEDMFYVVA